LNKKESKDEVKDDSSEDAEFKVDYETIYTHKIPLVEIFSEIRYKENGDLKFKNLLTGEESEEECLSLLYSLENQNLSDKEYNKKVEKIKQVL